MIINGIEREVHICEPTQAFPGTYKAMIEAAGDVDYLDRENLFDILQQEGLLYARIDFDRLHAFNDMNVMGMNAALDAHNKKQGHVQIGFSQSMVDMQVLPQIALALKGETPAQYAQRILGRVVPYLEDYNNYSATEMYNWKF